MFRHALLAGSALMALAACTTTGQTDMASPQAAAAAPAEAAAPAVPNNILLADWTGPYDGVPPWDQVKPELFNEAFQFAIDEQRREYQAISNNPEAPTFANTTEAM